MGGGGSLIGGEGFTSAGTTGTAFFGLGNGFLGTGITFLWTADLWTTGLGRLGGDFGLSGFFTLSMLPWSMTIR
jgi:hypothetical protein